MTMRSTACCVLLALVMVPSLIAAPGSDAQPPIPIRFTAPEAGFVTLVIEDAAGKRVRNLVSETAFPAGNHVVGWDGLDDLGRDTRAADHGVYHVPGTVVAPGSYRVRGLWRPQIDLRYQFTIYNPGQPPWETADPSSQWLANHTPPSGVLFVPEAAAQHSPAGATPGGQILVCSHVTEGGSGLAWLDLDGRKLRGQMWLGGVWTGASHLTHDAGAKRVPGVYAYAGAAWEGGGYDGTNSELRLAELLERDAQAAAPRDGRFGRGDDRPLLAPTAPYQGLLPRGAEKLPAPAQDNRYVFPDKEHTALSGLAAHNGVLVASLLKMNQLLFVDAAARRIIGTAPLENPRGIAFDGAGALLVLSGRQLLRVALPDKLDAPALGALRTATVITAGLEDPQGITLDSADNVYISDWGASHQVKVFTPEGKPLRTIGTAGGPKLGPYDPTRMHSPNGLAIDSRQCLWVAETDYVPKRVSVWGIDGKFVKAFYGPMEYGGGGTLDPRDKTRFYYSGMEFKIDWKTGASEPVAIYYLAKSDPLNLSANFKPRAPETAIYVKRRRYLTDCFGVSPTNAGDDAALWRLEDGIAVPVAALGAAGNWALLKTEPFQACLPAKLDLKNATFVWSDLNDDGQVQPAEVTLTNGAAYGITVMPDLAFVAAAADGKALRFAPVGFTRRGAPRYDLRQAEVLVTGTRRPNTSGGGQALAGENGWTILTVPPEPYQPQSSLSGAQRGKGQPLWVYPSMWPGLHSSHAAPLPEFPGELIGTTRLLGGFVKPRRSDAGQIWAVNGNKGNVYLFTADGLFVATLFKDGRTASWSAPKAERGMLVNDLSQNEENFWPSIAQTADGSIYLVTGAGGGSIVQVEGLERVKRLPEQSITVTADDLSATQTYLLRQETLRQQQKPRHALRVAMRTVTPTVDGGLDDWADADWAEIDKRITKVGDWGSRPDIVRAALMVAGDRLYAAFDTNDPELLRNGGDSLPMLFKTGGALDLMIGVDAHADPQRDKPVAGDERLLVTKVKDKLVAVLYRAVVADTAEPVVFRSPARAVTLDRVEDVSGDVQFSAGTNGVYEFSIPLVRLGLQPAAGQVLRGDLGILRGNGFQTLQRVYWQNKATGLTSDIPSEAQLTPCLWGELTLP